MEEYLALIPAAGMGSRAQQNMAKQFQKIGAKCLIEYSIEPFLRDEKCQKNLCGASGRRRNLG